MRETQAGKQPPYVTESESFRDVSRGDPKPHSLKGEALVKARMTRDTWRLEIVGDKTSELEKPRSLEKGNALDMLGLEALAKKHSVKFLKAMQCLNIPIPLGQGLWEGVPLREVLRLVGKMKNVRRVYYHGFHNNDPKQLFQSSLSYSQAMESPPGDLCPFVAYRLNGKPLSLVRGGPVRLVVPWAYGFKSIKWLQRITLTNDYKANDTYAEQNNDPESYLKTAAYIDGASKAVKAGEEVVVRGTAMVGWSGLKRVEYWLRPDTGTHGKLDDDDKAWESATWRSCTLDAPPTDWKAALPEGVKPSEVWGFDARTGKPKDWPMRYSVAGWSITLKGLETGAYEFRVRSVDLNGFAQPEPRPYPKSGRNEIQYRSIMVTA